MIGALDDYLYLAEVVTKLPETGYDNAIEFAGGSISSSTASTGFAARPDGRSTGASGAADRAPNHGQRRAKQHTRPWSSPRSADVNASKRWSVAGPRAANELHFAVAKGGHLQPLDLGVLHEGQHLRSSHEDVVYSRHCQLEPRARA